MSMLVFVVALLGALPIPMLAATYLTPLLTGWRPQPGLIQGCESSVHCAEMPTFAVTWIGSLIVYVAMSIAIHRRVVRWEAARSQRSEEAAWPWQSPR